MVLWSTEMLSATVFDPLGIDFCLLFCPHSSGTCVCKSGVYGPKCDDCYPGFFDFSSIGCRPCQCNNHTNYCHPQSGESAEDKRCSSMISFSLSLKPNLLFCFVIFHYSGLSESAVKSHSSLVSESICLVNRKSCKSAQSDSKIRAFV